MKKINKVKSIVPPVNKIIKKRANLFPKNDDWFDDKKSTVQKTIERIIYCWNK